MIVLKRTLIISFCVTVLAIINTSLAIVSWGERCDFTAECGDHRLVCVNITVEGVTEQLCDCDKFHEWNGSSVGCVMKYTTEEILEMLTEKYNVADQIEYEANLVFYAQIAAGLLVIGVGSFCSIVVIFYCLRMWRMDNNLDDLVEKLEAQKLSNKPTTSRLVR